MSGFTAFFLFIAVSLQFGGTGITAFLFIGLCVGLLYIFLTHYQKFGLAAALPGLSVGVIAFSSVFYIGNLAMLYYPAMGLGLCFLSIFLHNQVEQFASADDVASIYTAIKSRALQFAGIIGGAILLSIVYFPFLGFFPRIQTGILDVLLALIAVCVSLLILGWFMVRGEEKV
ncbi:MAG: hypothetical protein N3F63_05950 [Thermoplasmata archaeon]|nr:hypothetical protein [Thermoplasmata archaeon]